MITTITASSITKFLACQRAYYYRYEMGLQTVETSDALLHGTEATESEIPTGFYVGERNPELK